MISIRDDFNKLFSLLKEKTGLIEDELTKRIEGKKGILGHLVNDEVALRLVARDLGVSLYEDQVERPTVKLEDLIPGLNNVTIVVKVLKGGEIKEFTKKDGGMGKVARVKISDETGFATLVLWDENIKVVPDLIEGTTISIHSAYTKQGFNGVELHIGKKGKIEIISKVSNSLKGFIVRVYDPIDFTFRDGRRGRVVAFTVRNGQDTKVLVWNPSDEIIFKLKEGVYVEITGGSNRKGFYGESEVHVNNERTIKFCAEKAPEDISLKSTRLSEIKNEVKDMVLEGIIESELDLNVTQDGKQFVRLFIRDQETTLPITFWNDKAKKIKQMAKAGMRIRIEGCSSRFGPKGLEIVANRWSRIILE